MNETAKVSQPSELTGNLDGSFHVEQSEVDALSKLLDEAESQETKPDPESKPPKPEPESKPEPETKPDPEPKSEPEPEKPEEESKPEPDPEPSQDKAAKEKARKDKSWKALNEEKEALRKEREALEEERRKAQSQPQKQEPQTPQFTSEDYEKAAEHYEDKGEYTLAQAARDEAKRLKSQPKVDQRIAQEKAAAEFQSKQTESWNKTRAEFPEITDNNSEFRKEFESFVKQRPEIFGHPEAPYIVGQMIHDKLEAKTVPELRSEVETLRNKISELEKSTSIPGDTAPNSPSQRTERSFESMSVREQGDMLAREIAELRGD